MHAKLSRRSPWWKSCGRCWVWCSLSWDVLTIPKMPSISSAWRLAKCFTEANHTKTIPNVSHIVVNYVSFEEESLKLLSVFFLFLFLFFFFVCFYMVLFAYKYIWSYSKRLLIVFKMKARLNYDKKRKKDSFLSKISCLKPFIGNPHLSNHSWNLQSWVNF